MAKSTISLNKRITFQSAVEAVGADYSTTQTWSNISSAPICWANVANISGIEQIENGKLNYKQSVVFTIRARSDLSEEMRIVYNSINYYVYYLDTYINDSRYMKVKAYRRD